MAIIKMRKVTAIANKHDHERILKLLVDFGVAEIRTLAEYNGTQLANKTTEKDSINSKLALLIFALEYLAKQRKAVQSKFPDTAESILPKKPLFASKIALSKQEFEAIKEDEDEIFNSIKQLEDLSAQQIKLRTEISKNDISIESLKSYTGIDADFDMFTNSKSVTKVLGCVSVAKIDIVNQIIDKYPNAAIVLSEPIDGTQKQIPIVVLAKNDQSDQVLKDLQECDFIKCQYTFSSNADNEIERLKNENQDKSQQIDESIIKAVEFLKYESKFKILYDYYKLQLSLQEATETFRFTKNTFTFGFWTPERDVQKIKDIFDKEQIECFMVDEEPAEDDIVPTYTENNAFVSPFECITNMYSVPSYREKDPNAIMSVFYFILFGLMLGDAAYGLLLAIGGFLVYFLKKPPKGEGKLLLVIAMGGISTAIWGFLLGSWFGITPNKEHLWYWFNPLEDPLMMLVLSLGVGFLQILVGMFLQSIALIRQRKILDAIFNVYGWFVVFVGLGLLVLNMMVVKSDSLNLASIIVAIVGVAMLLIGGALGKNKKFFSKILGGFKNIYGVTNILSDVLSYARLFGLGLATGVVAMVVNQICSVIRDLLSFNIVGVIIGWIASIAIYVVGHTFNLAINTLGTYVHNCRLQYVEFYGRFYVGGGRLFKPLGKEKKYTYVD